MKRIKYLHSLYAVSICLICACTGRNDKEADLYYSNIPSSWDEGVPLGNGEIGALVWKKDSVLRLSLDRTDLWDLRPTENLDLPEFSFKWVHEQVLNKKYGPVQQLFDAPYDRLPAPSKIPGAALEFSLASLGSPLSTSLFYDDATCKVVWSNGTELTTFVDANNPVGWIKVKQAPGDWTPRLIAPKYAIEATNADNGPVAGLDLARLGYKQGAMSNTENKITYTQNGWEDFQYHAAIKWEKHGADWIGVWSMTSSFSNHQASNIVDSMLLVGWDAGYAKHKHWWKNYWGKSEVVLPDTLLQRQYMNECYKFGSASRTDGYPISLQAVWTADNGKLPPWKGDYHHDLNTQLSYWHCYTANQLDGGLAFLNTLWNQMPVHKAYTKQYFDTEGLNVPGVCTLTGEPMGGWIQYSCSPTVSAWLAQHFYLHWKYSADTVFLKERAYPYMSAVAMHLQQLSFLRDGKRYLPLCSSPEIHDNSINAWFTDWTNYDLALTSHLWKTTAELASVIGDEQQAQLWDSLRMELPSYALDNNGALAFAPGTHYNSSHRHFSHLMAFHPLGLIDYSQGEDAKKIIDETVNALDRVGPDYWVGYSYSWLANLKARQGDGDGAVQALTDFANCFILDNGFHVNGDQTKSGKSRFTYRPFTLEGNFAFASGVQEMLIQSHTDTIALFPAIPATWNDAQFSNLRTQGAHLFSATLANGDVTTVSITSIPGGEITFSYPSKRNTPQEERIVKRLNLKKGETIRMSL
ncbi:MAG: glycosyl hydrolase family 95 catalytic domain-containing protein [Marinifilaceae bacterium]